mmetsp:Transcript_37837/g.90870  ORF Transcript_37837/g.90870 Transcript_37837/m.90870 type:complete len:212 (-) Transcript_37837:474-1109(-)
MPRAKGVHLGSIKPRLRRSRMTPGWLRADCISILIPATRSRGLSPARVSSSSPTHSAVSRRWSSPSTGPGRVCTWACGMPWRLSPGSGHRSEWGPLRPSSGCVVKKRRCVREKIKGVFEWLRRIPAAVAEVFPGRRPLVAKDISTRTCFLTVVARSTNRTKFIFPTTIPPVPSLAGLHRMMLNTRKAAAVRAFPAPRLVPSRSRRNSGSIP